MTGHLPSPEPATHTAHQENADDTIPENEEANGKSEVDAPTEQPVEEKKKPQRPRIPMQRTYSRPTYPSHRPIDASKTDLDP